MGVEEKIEIVVEVSWQLVELVTSLTALPATAWASGVFYELLLSLSPFLRPVQLTLSRDGYPPSGTIDLRVCIARWVKADELRLLVISPDGALLYSGEISIGSVNCMSSSVALRGATEGVYTAAVVRGNNALAIVNLKVTG